MDSIWEIHGALTFLQCSKPCSTELTEIGSEFKRKLQEEEGWVPRCEKCNVACLRPNVMIFCDRAFVCDHLEKQTKCAGDFESNVDTEVAVLEIEAGLIVPSIRLRAKALWESGRHSIRVNSSPDECTTIVYLCLAGIRGMSWVRVPCQSSLAGKFFPLIWRMRRTHFAGSQRK